MPAITTRSERTDHWTKMPQRFARFNGSAPSHHTRSLAGFIIITFGFRFSVHTGKRRRSRLRTLDGVRYWAQKALRIWPDALVPAALWQTVITAMSAFGPKRTSGSSLNGPRLKRYDCSVLSLGEAMRRRVYITSWRGAAVALAVCWACAAERADAAHWRQLPWA